MEEEIDFDTLSNKEMKDLLKQMHSTIKEMKRQIEKQEHYNKQTNNECKNNESKINIITKAIVKHDKTINTVTNKVNSIEARSMKANIIISGIKEAEGKDCKQTVTDFFKQKLKIPQEIPIQTAHRIGNKEKGNCSLAVKLSDVAQKALIFKGAKHLKDIKNEEGDGYYINDQLPDVQTKRKQKQRDKVKLKKTLVAAQ